MGTFIGNWTVLHRMNMFVLSKDFRFTLAFDVHLFDDVVVYMHVCEIGGLGNVFSRVCKRIQIWYGITIWKRCVCFPIYVILMSFMFINSGQLKN